MSERVTPEALRKRASDMRAGDDEHVHVMPKHPGHEPWMWWRAADIARLLRDVAREIERLREVEKRAVPEGWSPSYIGDSTHCVQFETGIGGHIPDGYRLYRSGKPPQDLGWYPTWQQAIATAEAAKGEGGET